MARNPLLFRQKHVRRGCTVSCAIIYFIYTTSFFRTRKTPKTPPPTSTTANTSDGDTLFQQGNTVALRSIKEDFDIELARLKFRAIFSTSISNDVANNMHPSNFCDLVSNSSEFSFTVGFEEILAWASHVRRESRLLHVVQARAPKVFIAGLLYNNCEIMTHYIYEVLKFLLIFGYDVGFKNVLLSLYASGSRDCTASLLDRFKELLDTMKVPNIIKTRQPERRPGSARIDFLQSIRNKAMKPLYLSDEKFDEVIFLSDTLFCVGDIVRLLIHDQASIKCGLDFDGSQNAMKFRDTWVAHDMSGKMFTKEFPFVHDNTSVHALEDGTPFQVSCCWNGLVALNARVFVDFGARFRRSLDKTECHAAETELICHDFAALGFPKVLIDPHITVAYTNAEYIALSKSISSRDSYSLKKTNLLENELIETVRTWETLPSRTECAPLDGHTGNHPDRGQIHYVDWNAHYSQVGVPIASTKMSVELHACTGPSASQCVLIGGTRVPMVPP